MSTDDEIARADQAALTGAAAVEVASDEGTEIAMEGVAALEAARTFVEAGRAATIAGVSDLTRGIDKLAVAVGVGKLVTGANRNRCGVSVGGGRTGDGAADLLIAALPAVLCMYKEPLR